MRFIKIISVFTLISLLASCERLTYDHRLKQMGKMVENHFKYNDKENEVVTTLKTFVPISYERIAKSDTVNADAEFLFRAYVQGYWHYHNSNLVYNMNDTIEVFFDKDYNYLRTKKNK